MEQTYSQTVLLDLTGNKPQAVSKTLDFTFPSDVVSGSERVQVTAVGKDHLILFPSLSFTDQLYIYFLNSFLPAGLLLNSVSKIYVSIIQLLASSAGIGDF